ncbi:MAG TPA: YbaB/EbfC family nucleoid-associated protein [Spirillospora sp.]|nr:YbaB/EbfC family nucleoid-associated protein [Spirillospora sp.]
MSRRDNKLRRQLNVSVPSAPRSDEEVEERKRRASSKQGSEESKYFCGTTECSEIVPDAEVPSFVEALPRRYYVHPVRREPAAPLPPTPDVGNTLSDNHDVREFTEARQKKIELVVEKASRRLYTEEGKDREVSVKIDGNGQIIDLSVSNYLLRREQSQTISALVMSVITRARSKAARDWMTSLPAENEVD